MSPRVSSSRESSLYEQKLLSIIDNVKKSDNGKFFAWDGQEIPWWTVITTRLSLYSTADNNVLDFNSSVPFFFNVHYFYGSFSCYDRPKAQAVERASCKCKDTKVNSIFQLLFSCLGMMGIACWWVIVVLQFWEVFSFLIYQSAPDASR